MSTNTRIYVVSSAISDGGERLIRAATPAQALRHAAHGLFDVEIASQDRLVELAGKGIKVEVAGEEPPNTDGQQQ